MHQSRLQNHPNRQEMFKSLLTTNHTKKFFLHLMFHYYHRIGTKRADLTEKPQDTKCSCCLEPVFVEQVVSEEGAILKIEQTCFSAKGSDTILCLFCLKGLQAFIRNNHKLKRLAGAQLMPKKKGTHHV